MIMLISWNMRDWKHNLDVIDLKRQLSDSFKLINLNMEGFGSSLKNDLAAQTH